VNDEPMRGRIRHRERAKQLRDFSGLQFGRITPTDIDGVIEFRDKLYVFIEYKIEGAPMDFGQRLCFERMTRRLTNGGCHAYAIVAEHNTSVYSDIDAANAIVKEVCAGGKWHEATKGNTVFECINLLYEKHIDPLPGKPL
jgi:hypothetical protein